MISMCPRPYPSRHLATVQDTDSEDDDDVAFLPPFSGPPSVATSHTSHNASIRSASPAPSVWSITSSLREQAYRLEYGRGLNNYSEVYRLPADEAELDRLNKQHRLITEVIGKYPSCLPDVMADDVPGETKACLDLGCGSGAWIMDLAREFPNCSAVAVDLVPMQCSTMPANCRSEMDDINLGLEHFYGDFNVVRAHLICSGIKDYSHLIDQIAHVVRPGGLVDFLEFDFRVYDENHNPVEDCSSAVGGPWWPRFLAFCVAAIRAAGGADDAALHLGHWIRERPLFEDVVSRDYWVPVSPFKSNDPTSVRFGTAMRDNLLAFLKSCRPLLLKNDVPENIFHELETNTEAELHEARYHHYIRFCHVYARRKHPLPR